MKLRLAVLFALGVAAIVNCQFGSVVAKAKQWTVTQRQEALLAKVNKGEKSNELTKKEADKLRQRLSDLSEKIEKEKSKNGGKLSYKDEGKAEKALNSISLELDKLELNKRVVVH